MSDNKQAPQRVRITLTGERSDGTQLEQVLTAKAGDCFEIGEDGYATKYVNPLNGLVKAWVPSPDGTMVEVTPHRKSAEQESTDAGELTPQQIEVIHRTVCQRIREEMDALSPVHFVPTRYLHMLLDAVDTAVSMMQDAPNPISERN